MSTIRLLIPIVLPDMIDDFGKTWLASYKWAALFPLNVTSLDETLGVGLAVLVEESV